jgi:hypothetical protein
MTATRLLGGLCLAVSFSLLGSCPAGAQEKAADSSPPAVDARAMLNKTADFLSKADQFSVTIRAEYDVVQTSGQKIEFGEIRKISLRRPDRFRSDFERSDGEKGLMVFDGKTITVFNDKQKVYAVASRPGDLDGAVIYLLKDLGMRLPLAMMYLSRLPAEIDNRVRSVKTVEQSTIMDPPCVHLAVQADDVDFQIWIPAQGDPLPRRIVITYKQAYEQPQFEADFSEWSLSPSFPNALFTFSPPEGAQQIPFLAQLELAGPRRTNAKSSKKGAGTK